MRQGSPGRPHTLGVVETEPVHPSETVVAPEGEITPEPVVDHDRVALEALEAELAVLEEELALVDADRGDDGVARLAVEESG